MIYAPWVNPHRRLPALEDWEPYDEPDGPGWAPYSMVGTCSTHGFQRVTRETTVGRADPTIVFWFACGCAEPIRP